ncbi:hypothetical protein ACFO4N_14855 [Camelliibacillus cellulosilyticus]|uniref:DUF4352 domain-containing protein n=1 Tax=Camelliibacillus cellulosilyticus TaxID=2174486 RepID=A0ABV9GP68_9BACL
MRKRTILILVVIVLAFAAWGVRVYTVNAGVARHYDIRTYQIGDTINLGDTTFKVKQFSYGKKVKKTVGYNWVTASVVMEVRNTSDKALAITKIIESKLAYDMDVIQTRDGDFDVGKLRSLPPNETTEIRLDFDVRAVHKGESAKLYLDQDLYYPLVEKKYKEGKRYGIAVKLRT